MVATSPLVRPRTLAQGLILALAAGLITLLALGLSARAPKAIVGNPAPEFELELFDGGVVRLSALRGNVVVINFWASWCGPCRDEAPILVDAWHAYRDRGVVFIGIDYVDTEPEARAFMQEFAVDYPNGPDKGQRIARQYQITGVPETFFIDRQGRVAAHYPLPLTRDLLISNIELLLTA